jgi:ApaG protein
MKKITIKISAHAAYLVSQSLPEEQRYMWSYEITIDNQSEEIVQLLNRYWRIIDMTGHVEEVRGPGVIGLQPIIKPGKKFVYTSFCQLATPQGTMEGHYEMQTLEEVRFTAQVPKFVLACPAEMSGMLRAKLH